MTDVFHHDDAALVDVSHDIAHDTNIYGYNHIDPHHVDTTHMSGDPQDVAVWHEQTLPDDCAVVSQEFVLNEITGGHFTEQQCVATAQTIGAYDHGTTPDHVGDLLNAYGIPTANHYGATLDEIRAHLDQHEKVIVGVDSSVLVNDPIPGHHGDHAVQVVAVDDTDPQHPKIILNDPAVPDGQGVVIPAEKFFEVWGPSGNFMMNTVGGGTLTELPPIPTPQQVYAPTLMGYSNADGTYHYDSDNTDRDPETGAIVRRW